MRAECVRGCRGVFRFKAGDVGTEHACRIRRAEGSEWEPRKKLLILQRPLAAENGIRRRDPTI